MSTHYTARGPVRGCCGHKHRSLEAALRCVNRDQSGCASQGGYSDRSVYAVEDGSVRDLTDDELAALDHFCDWSR